MADILADRKIFVTGAATGIGAAAVHVLAAAGADVVATFHRTTPESEASSGARWVQCDVRDEESVEAAVNTAAELLGGIDVVVHAAGAWAGSIPGQIATADIAHVMDTNFTSTVLVNQSCYRQMRESGGAIINFGSSEGVSGSPVAAVYAAAKGAVQAWTKSAARAWGAGAVTVNALAPAVQTPGADRRREFLGEDAAAAERRALAAAIPIGGTLGDPVADLGPLLVFLCGTGARFITGQLIAVNGGLLMLS